MESNFKNDTSELVLKTERDLQTENRLMVTKSEMCGEGYRELGISRHTLVCIRQTISKDLAYSTGNSSQYSVITYT